MKWRKNYWKTSWVSKRFNIDDMTLTKTKKEMFYIKLSMINRKALINEWLNWIEAKFKYGAAGSVASRFFCPSTIVGIDLPGPFFWIPSLDAMLIFVPNRTRRHWHYSDPNTVQRVRNLSRSMASRILNHVKTALLLLGPSMGNPHEQLGHPQPQASPIEQ